LLKRTSLNIVNNKLKQNVSWNILDVGCGYRPNPHATTIADIQDFSKLYKEKNFVRLVEKKLPFKDKEFDFVIASHVIEHVEDFEFFIHELERISSRGYIELPTRLGDNLVFENKHDHIWWFKYDDDINKLIASKKNQLVDPFITVSTAKYFEEVFRESLVMEVEWDEKINYIIDNNIRNENYQKISFLKIVKKYISKKIRNLYK
jgi:ubiquinone/menaquinone biosynthesis C-methylase UbiE